MKVIKAIKTKRAVRDFTDQPISQEDIDKILFAGRRSQSAKNSQPWHFILIEKPEIKKALSKLGTYASHLANAKIVIAIITPHPDTRFSVMFDAGQSAAYMQLMSWELGVGSCLATIYEPDAARDLLGFPENMHIRIAISFGFPQNPALLTNPPKSGGRLPTTEIIHQNEW